MHGEQGLILVAPVEQYKAMNVKLVSTQISKVISRSPYIRGKPQFFPTGNGYRA